MTKQEAINAYVEKFGGWPGFLMMGASDEYIIESVKRAIETGREIKPEKGLIY